MSGRACDLLFEGPEAFRDRHSLYRWTENGIPPTDVVKLISRFGILRDGRILHQVLGFSSRSLHRRRQKSDRQLSPDQSARLFRFAEIQAKATVVFGSSEDAQS
uniref:antitoxin Xre-like helix-turn-helix domain-containing protein n=1 Tax=Pseudomonas sp. G.S.17 TaxID=3137451 RepID=UPI00405415C7